MNDQEIEELLQNGKHGDIRKFVESKVTTSSTSAGNITRELELLSIRYKKSNSQDDRDSIVKQAKKRLSVGANVYKNSKYSPSKSEQPKKQTSTKTQKQNSTPPQKQKTNEVKAEIKVAPVKQEKEQKPKQPESKSDNKNKSGPNIVKRMFSPGIPKELRKASFKEKFKYAVGNFKYRVAGALIIGLITYKVGEKLLKKTLGTVARVKARKAIKEITDPIDKKLIEEINSKKAELFLVKSTGWLKAKAESVKAFAESKTDKLKSDYDKGVFKLSSIFNRDHRKKVLGYVKQADKFITGAHAVAAKFGKLIPQDTSILRY